jgi:hypothetical protein
MTSILHSAYCLSPLECRATAPEYFPDTLSKGALYGDGVKVTRGTAITVPIEGVPMSELISPETLRHVIDISQPLPEGIEETSSLDPCSLGLRDSEGWLSAAPRGGVCAIERMATQRHGSHRARSCHRPERLRRPLISCKRYFLVEKN